LKIDAAKTEADNKDRIRNQEMSMELNQKKMEFQSQNETYSINQQIQKVAENNKLIEVQNSAKIAALDNTLLYKDKEKQQEFTHQEIAMEV
jgi:hypothetical protein